MNRKSPEIDEEIKQWCKEHLDVDPQQLVEHIYQVVEREKTNQNTQEKKPIKNTDRKE